MTYRSRRRRWRARIWLIALLVVLALAIWGAVASYQHNEDLSRDTIEPQDTTVVQP